MEISAKQVEDLKLIAVLSEENISSICEAADQYHGDLTETESILDLIKPHSALDEASLKSISSAISGLLFAYIASEQSDVEFIPQLLSSVIESEVTFDESELKSLECNLFKLFSNVSLFRAHKALSLFMENERLMVGARILTDIRPVFEQSTIDNILGYSISHTLKIAYRDSRSTGEFFVSLDSSDLQSLKKIIDREITKQETIRSQSGIAFNNGSS